MTKTKKKDKIFDKYDIQKVSYLSELPKKYYLYIANDEGKTIDENVKYIINEFEKKINRKINGKIFIKGRHVCIADQQFISERENPLFEEEEINE